MASILRTSITNGYKLFLHIVCYSERILNPFRGVMNVIALDDAEAVTTDGVNWSLYVRDYFDTADDDPEEFAHIDNPHIRFGIWSEESGLIRAPATDHPHNGSCASKTVMVMASRA